VRLTIWQPHPEARKGGSKGGFSGRRSRAPEAVYNLGICYAVGVGVRKDNIQAYKYMYAAKERGYDANEALAKLDTVTNPITGRQRFTD